MAIVSVHEAPLKETPEVEKEPEKKSTVKMVKELLDRGKRARSRWDSSWQANYEFVFGGRQWNVDRPSWRFSEVQNVLWDDLMTEVGIQTDSRPKVEYGATEPGDFEFASRLKEINDVNWQRYPWLQKVSDCVLGCKWVHVQHCEVFWNPELEDGVGDLDLAPLDPFYCYWDPFAKDERELRWFIWAGPVPTGELKHKYPDQEIKSDIETIGSGYNQRDERISVDSDRGFGGGRNPRASKPSDAFGGEPMTFLIRCWLKDQATENFAEEKEVNGVKETEYQLRLKYPKGRYVEIACGKVLQDGPNGIRIGDKIEAYEHGEIPVARLVNYSYPLEYAGENEVTHRRGPQRALNYVWSHLLDQMKMGSNPKTIIGASSGVDPDNVTNEPGIKILANDVNQVRFEPGVGIASGMDNILERAYRGLDRVGGVGDVMRGTVDPSVSSGLLFDGYVEAAQVKPRLKNRNLDQFLTRIGQLQLALYLQFYTAPRVFRITGKEGYTDFVEFYISEEGGKKYANFRTQRLEEAGVPQTAKMEIKGVPDVKVQAGSSLPFAKAQKTQSAMNLFNAQAIDQEALLEAVDWPDKEAVIERMKAQAEQMAQMQAVQGGGK